MKSGKISESVLQRSVLRQIKTKNKNIINGAAVGADCAIFDTAEDDRLVSCMQEAVIIVSEDELLTDPYGAMTMEQLLTKCANNLVCKGALPIAFQIGLMLPAEFEEAGLKELMRQANETCERLALQCYDTIPEKKNTQIQIVGGQTFVTEAVRRPVAMVTGYAVASVPEPASNDLCKLDLVLTKWIGLEGTAYLAGKYEKDLCERYSGHLIQTARTFDSYMSVIPEAKIAWKVGAVCLHDASKGGIFGALWEMAQSMGVGMKIDLKKLPLRQETVEVCELCNVNPYELMCGGCLIIAAENGENMVQALMEQEISAVVVGHTTDGKERILINEDEVRYMDRPKQDALYEKLMQP